MVQMSLALTELTYEEFQAELTLWKLAEYHGLRHSHHEHYLRHVWVGTTGLICVVRDHNALTGENTFYRPAWPMYWVDEVEHLDPP